MEKYVEISNRELNQLMFSQPKNKTPFGFKKTIYADFIASGRPSPIVEKYIIDNIYGKYSNTHSNADNGIFMKNCIKRVREIVKREYKIGDDYEILFKGSGCTGAVNHLIDSLDFSKYNRVFIFISAYEHYSNHLTWLELVKAHPSKFRLLIIPLQENNELDLSWFENQIKNLFEKKQKNTLLISSIIHCSNLFGYFTPIKQIKTLLHSAKNKYEINTLLFCDLACSAPYVKINGNMFDAFFLSPHKFVGGVETPGLLVAKTTLFQKDHPTEPGGSCIKKTHYNHVEYSTDIEIRESAGTPNIIGIIKIGLCLNLKAEYQSIITNNEHLLVQLIKEKTRFFKRTYSNFRCIDYDWSVKRLPIFSFSITGLHYNLVVVLLNDLFGIQTRGGRACDGLLSDYIKDEYGIDGFCRVSFHWTMNQKTVDYIFNSVEYLLKNGEEYKPLYSYNEKENLFHYKGTGINKK